jgi:hypothetical protein
MSKRKMLNTSKMMFQQNMMYQSGDQSSMSGMGIASSTGGPAMDTLNLSSVLRGTSLREDGP